jgi:hypothetical protein
MHSFDSRGATACTSPAGLGAVCDIIIVLVVNAEQTEEVLFGERGAVSSMAQGSVLVLRVTLSPGYAEQTARRLLVVARIALQRTDPLRPCERVLPWFRSPQNIQDRVCA